MGFETRFENELTEMVPFYNVIMIIIEALVRTNSIKIGLKLAFTLLCNVRMPKCTYAQ